MFSASFFLLSLVDKLAAHFLIPMKVAVVSNKKEWQQWLELPDFIYASDSNYIPHIRQDVAGIFDSNKNKLFAQGKASCWILLNDSNQPIGRIAAFFSKKYSDAQHQQTGGIGFLMKIYHY